VAALLMWGCNQTAPVATPVAKVQINPADAGVSMTTDNMPADGSTVNTAQFKGGPSVDSFYSMVTFSIAPNGRFSNDSTQITVPLDIDGHATVNVTSRMPGVSIVSATVGGVTVQTPTTFTIAWPQEVVIAADSTFLTPLPGLWTAVTATLLRNPGRVSAGVFVRFYDSTTVDSVIGVFDGPVVTDTSGILIRQYFITDTSYHGTVFINGAVGISPGDTVEGSTRLQIR
jgi:hypothetical protein